jgi:hypothetical protein
MSKRILVVEDQPDNRQIIRDMLAPTDYEITEAENGEEAKPYSQRELLATPQGCKPVRLPKNGAQRINPARVNSVSEVVAYRVAACAEVARDYRRFVVSRLALEESQVSRCQHQRHSHFWQGRPCDCRRRQEPLLQRVYAVAVIYRY